jgi:signal transduction histidine kinase
MERLRLETAHRELLEREVLEIATREQMRIGQELHDSVGQELTGLGLMADALAQRLDADAGHRSIATKLVAGIDRLHRQVRGLSRGLVPVHVESHGLWAALDDLAAGSTEQTGVLVSLESQGVCDLVDHYRATELFRIAQEAVSNALRHGKPKRVRICLVPQADCLRLTIEDDGTGIATNAAPSPGMGLRIMEYRAQQIGATFEIGAAPRGGTIVHCVLPARHASQATAEQFTHANAG